MRLASDLSDPQGFILRSHKLHEEQVPESLLAVARAGAGVNNVPVSDYTDQGIVVFNTPGANANAVKELNCCGSSISLSRYLWRHELCSRADAYG